MDTPVVLTQFKTFAFLTSVLALLGCGEQALNQSASEIQSLDGSANTLRLITYEEYFAESVLTKFTQKTGIAVDYIHCENTIEMRAHLQSNAGKTDLVIADDVSTDEFTQLGLIQPINYAEITGFENLDRAFLDHSFDPQNRFSVPYLWGTTLIAYRTDWNASPEKSWSTVIDPSSNARIGWLNEANDIIGFALLASGHSVDTNDSAALQDAVALMSEYVKTRRPVVSGMYDVLDMLDAGELDAVVTYSGDAALYAEDNEKIAYFIPQEGAAMWLDSFSIAQNAPNKSAAHQFISFILRPEIAAENAEALWFATPNKAAIAHLDEEFLDEEGLWPRGQTRERLSFLNKSTHERNVIVSQGMRLVMDLIRQQNDENAIATGPVTELEE